MKKKLVLGLSILSVTLLAIGGSLALLTSEDSDYNTMTVGKAQIEQIEQQRGENGLEEFTQDKALYPTTSKELTKEENGFFTSTVTNAQDKIVSVKNTGLVSIYYRTVIAVEAPAGAENAIIVNKNETEDITWSIIDGTTTINGVNYKLLVATYNNALLPLATSEESLLQVVMTRNSTNETVELFGEKVDILVMSQAVQAAGYANANEALLDAFGEVTSKRTPWTGTLASTTEELVAAFAEGGTVTLTNDIALASPLKLTGDTEVVFNTNGKRITVAEDAEWIEVKGYTDIKDLFVPLDHAKLTINGGGIIDLEKNYDVSVLTPWDYTDIVIEDITIIKHHTQEFIPEGATGGAAEGPYGALFPSSSGGRGSITIYSGYFDSGFYQEGNLYSNCRTLLNSSWGTTKERIYGGTFVAQNPALGDEGTGNQGFFLEGQSKSNPEIPSGFTITEGVTNDGTNRPTYTVTYDASK